VQNLVAQGVHAIIVNPVDSSATPQLTKLATSAGIPLVYVNRAPEEKDLPAKVVFVGSDENISGRSQAEEIARLLGNKGNVAILQGDVGTVPGILRMVKVEEVVAQHSDMMIVHKDAANFLRTQATDVVNNWLTTSEKIDAIAANNDEMAIGAIVALQQAGIDPKTVVIGGIDATREALEQMSAGNLAVTVFQDAAGQGKGAVTTAVKLIHGDQVDSRVWIPFQLVTRENYKQFPQ
jgi:inositol transport system substrate-binding protein